MCVCFVSFFNTPHRWLDLFVHKEIITIESEKHSAFSASPTPPAWQLPELESSRLEVQGDLRLQGPGQEGNGPPVFSFGLGLLRLH